MSFLYWSSVSVTYSTYNFCSIQQFFVTSMFPLIRIAPHPAKLPRSRQLLLASNFFLPFWEMLTLLFNINSRLCPIVKCFSQPPKPTLVSHFDIADRHNVRHNQSNHRLIWRQAVEAQPSIPHNQLRNVLQSIPPATGGRQFDTQSSTSDLSFWIDMHARKLLREGLLPAWSQQEGNCRAISGY